MQVVTLLLLLCFENIYTFLGQNWSVSHFEEQRFIKMQGGHYLLGGREVIRGKV